LKGETLSALEEVASSINHKTLVSRAQPRWFEKGHHWLTHFRKCIQ